MFGYHCKRPIVASLTLIALYGFSASITGAQMPVGGVKGEWDGVVAAAKKEGKLALLAPAGDVYRHVWDAFKNKYGIAMEVFSATGGSVFVPRVDAERQAGQFLWDVAVSGPPALFTLFKSKGWLVPLRPALLLPEVLDDSKWMGGLARGFTDQERSLVYAFVSEIQGNVHINRSVIPDSQLSKLDQLWEPRWAGKIAMIDPLFPSAGEQIMATWLAAKGEEKLRAFVRDQRPVFTRDIRQLGEWAVRARYPIALGLVPSVLAGFTEAGLPIEHIKPLADDDPATVRLSYGVGAVVFLNHAPHPNAAKVFINWLLSQEGQTIYAQRTSYNVRRTDVAIVAPDRSVDPKKKYLDVTLEETYPLREKVVKIIREIVK